MIKPRILLASSALALGLCATGASAQNTGKPIDAHPSTTAPGKGPAIQNTTTTDPHALGMSATPARASKLIGTEIQDSAGKELATIKDLMVADSGELVACVERKDDLMLCVPLANLEPRLSKSDVPEAKAKELNEAVMSGETPDVQHFVFKGDRAQFDSAPAVKDASMLDRSCMTRSMDHFAGRKADMSKDTTDPSRTDSTPGHDMAAVAPSCLKELIGDDVKATDGDKIGDVTDVAINLQTNRIAYVVISTGGVLGVGDKHHAVAFDQLTLGDGSVTIPMTKDGASKLPELDLDRLPANPTGIVSMRTEKSSDTPTDRKHN